MRNGPKLRVKDITTREVFSVSWDNTAFIKTQDGVRVKLHPNFMRIMIPVGSKFDGNTLTGPRLMERVK